MLTYTGYLNSIFIETNVSRKVLSLLRLELNHSTTTGTLTRPGLKQTFGFLKGVMMGPAHNNTRCLVDFPTIVSADHEHDTIDVSNSGSWKIYDEDVLYYLVDTSLCLIGNPEKFGYLLKEKYVPHYSPLYVIDAVNGWRSGVKLPLDKHGNEITLLTSMMVTVLDTNAYRFLPKVEEVQNWYFQSIGDGYLELVATNEFGFPFNARMVSLSPYYDKVPGEENYKVALQNGSIVTLKMSEMRPVTEWIDAFVGKPGEGYAGRTLVEANRLRGFGEPVEKVYRKEA